MFSGLIHEKIMDHHVYLNTPLSTKSFKTMDKYFAASRDQDHLRNLNT